MNAVVQLTLGLDEIAVEIHRVWDETKRHQVAAWEGYFTTGRLLIEARSRFPADQDYGRWFAAQRFPFASNWGRRLMIAARSESEVRPFLDSALTRNPPGVDAVLEFLHGKASRADQRAESRQVAAVTPLPTEHVDGVRYRCIVLDPPWDPSDEGDVDQMGRAQPLYATMPIADIEALPVADLAEPAGCHLYLWITNRSLPKGFDLLEAWGFRHVTALTWCKPTLGIGNYFRNNTEHILFGVKGSLGALYQDVPTWFEASRGELGHSSKPERAYDLIRRVSPGPRLEMFARHEREGFVVWGSEVAS